MWVALMNERRKVERLTGVVKTLWDVVGKGFPGNGEFCGLDLDLGGLVFVRRIAFLNWENEISHFEDLTVINGVSFSTGLPRRLTRK